PRREGGLGMYRTYRIVSAVLFLLIASATHCLAQALPAPSVWQNQRGSVMKILALDPATGAFSGIYINNAVGFKCQGTPYAMWGGARGSRVVFNVIWKNNVEDCKSSTVWYGRTFYRTIQTNWVLTYVDQNGNIRKMRGSDTFQQQ